VTSARATPKNLLLSTLYVIACIPFALAVFLQAPFWWLLYRIGCALGRWDA
jgi:hypothetical protein